MVLFLHACHPDVTEEAGRPPKAAFNSGIVGIRLDPIGMADDGLDHFTRQAIERHSIKNGMTGEAQRFHEH